MQTVQFQCGKCGKLMAVGTEHLGAQVHCPHCMQIVRAPAAEAIAAPEPPIEDTIVPEIHPRNPDGVEEGSIFGGSSEEDLFHAPQEPLVEMPAAPVVPVASPTPAPPQFEAEAAPLGSVRAADDHAALTGAAQAHWMEAAAEESQLPGHAIARPRAGNSMLVPILLIFLIPYSIVCTGYIVWTLIHPPGSSFDPMELLRDPKPGDGGPKRVPPETTLPNKLKTSLHKPIEVGALMVMPLRVLLVDDNLVLQLKMRNLSRDLAFNPLPDSFGKFTEKARPYTFLDTGKDKLYGGFVEWLHNDRAGTGIIGPGEENITILTTTHRAQPKIRAILESKTPLLWRVQVRRGLVDVGSKAVSATAVIGVVFSASEIEKGKAEARLLPSFGNPRS